MAHKTLGILALVLAACSLLFPIMSVGEITTGAFVGVVQDKAYVVFAVPALGAGLAAGISGLLGPGKKRSIMTIVLGVLGLSVWILLMTKLKSGAAAELGLYAIGATGLFACIAGVVGLTTRVPSRV